MNIKITYIFNSFLEYLDSVRLVDVANMLPGLKYSPGMTHWLPASKDITFYKSAEEIPEKWLNVVRPAMFPPSPEDVSKYHLERW